MTSETLYCQATLNFADAQQAVAVTMDIRDGRKALAELNFEDCGFTLLNHSSTVINWRDQEELVRVHRAEIKELALQLSGCDKAVVYQPLVRSPVTSASHDDYAPIEAVHSDYTSDYRAMVTEPDRAYRSFLDPLLAEEGLSQADVASAGRIMVLQFWRNIGATYPDRPFALCDASTSPRNEMMTMLVPEYAGERLEFETFIGIVPEQPSSQHWYTFPGLDIDEVIAFRTYDSRCDEQNRAFWTPHSAFLDPHTGEGAPKRESLEMRVLCLFDA